MSSMISAPPPSIALGGPGGPGPSGPMGGAFGPAVPPGMSAKDGANDPDSGNVTSLLKKALALVDQAATAEKDSIDESAIRGIAQSISKAIANEQGLVDKAMGAGPGVKLIRKNAPAGGGGGSQGGGY